MKILKLVITIILVVSLMAGCFAKKPSEAPSEPASTPTEPTTTPTTTPTTDTPEPTRAPVSTLQCTTPAALSAICPAGGTKALVGWTDYMENRTTLQIVDVAADSVCAETTLSGVWEFKKQTFSDGRLAFCSRDTLEWKFLNTSLDEVGAMDAENVDGFFSFDGSSYYYLSSNVLCCQNAADGEVSKVPLDFDLRFMEITAFNNRTGRMVLQFYLSDYSGACGTAILNITTGQMSMLQEESYQAVFTGDGLCLMNFDADTMRSSVSYEWEDGVRFAAADIFAERSNELYGVPGAYYLIGTAEDSTLYAIGEQISASALADYGIRGEMYSVCLLPDEKLLLGAVYQGDKFRLFAIDPSLLTFTELAQAPQISSPFTVNADLAKAYWAETTDVPVAEALQEARAYADTLEAKYHVDILLSSQCRNAATLCEYPITMSEALGTETEQRSISAALESLDRTLALYPDGFFAQFQNSMNEGGLRFLLVEEIDNGLGAVGCTFENGDWQNIAMDIRSHNSMDGIICHELWHATENHILSRDRAAFSSETWAALNPEGFTYTGDSTLIDSDRLRWTLYGGSTDTIYFVDDYAQVDEREDRARIMEYVMVHPDEAKKLVQAPGIRQKLQWMATTVCSHFDTNGWGTTRWEELL